MKGSHSEKEHRTGIPGWGRLSQDDLKLRDVLGSRERRLSS